MVEIRPFARSDKERLSRLVNAHVAALTPGGSIPAATLLNDLERPVGEDVIGPWVRELTTLVACEHDRLVGAAHLRRYGENEAVSASYRNAGEIVWLLCWPDHLDAGRVLRDAALALLGGWKVRVAYADGSLAAPGVYGVSDAWPHVRLLYEEAGFDAADGQVELVLAGDLEEVPSPGDPPIEGLVLHRRLGTLGTAFCALFDGAVVGAFEVDDDLTRGGSNLAFAGWADVANHWVREDLQWRGIGTWLVSHAGVWLRLGGRTRLMAYVIEDADAKAWCRYYRRYGVVAINRTTRGWTKWPSRA